MLSRDALWLIHALSQEYKYPGWLKNFTDKDLFDALKYLEDENQVRTVPRREMIRKEIQRRTVEERAVLSKVYDTKLPAGFCAEWNRTCAEIREKIGGPS